MRVCPQAICGAVPYMGDNEAIAVIPSKEGTAVPARFVSIADVAETLAISARQAYGLVTSGELPAIKVGKSWRVELTELEAYIERQYADTQAKVSAGDFDGEA